jgi:hypothetical protein
MAHSWSEGTEMNQEGQREITKETPVKKTYTAPCLLEYGNVAKLTQGGNSAGTDIGPAGMNMTCL